jgi:hypothetical protein
VILYVEVMARLGPGAAFFGDCGHSGREMVYYEYFCSILYAFHFLEPSSDSLGVVGVCGLFLSPYPRIDTGEPNTCPE